MNLYGAKRKTHTVQDRGNYQAACTRVRALPRPGVRTWLAVTSLCTAQQQLRVFMWQNES